VRHLWLRGSHDFRSGTHHESGRVDQA